MVGLAGSHGVEFKDDNEVCMVTRMASTVKQMG